MDRRAVQREREGLQRQREVARVRLQQELCRYLVSLTAEAEDDCEPGRDDTFTISVSAGPSEGDILRGGNTQIHE
jgi:hypothetical protein